MKMPQTDTSSSSSSSSFLLLLRWRLLGAIAIIIISVLVIPFSAVLVAKWTMMTTIISNYSSLLWWWYPKQQQQDDDHDTHLPSQHVHHHHRQEPMPLLDQLFPNPIVLDSAWERYPLLSTFYNNNNNNNGNHDENKMDPIPTLLLNYNETQQQQRLELVNNLFSIKHIFPILYPDNNNKNKQQEQQPIRLKHGRDYRVVRKIFDDNGEEWTTMPQESYIPPKQLLTMIQQQQEQEQPGWSLIVNQMQDRWKSITQFANVLQMETNAMHVNCNLYLTPTPPTPPKHTQQQQQEQHGTTTTTTTRITNSGFESHWDEMDVIVIQLIGEKIWSIAKEPQIYLSTPDQRYKPNQQILLNKTLRYQNIVLRQGDVLYIPRGYIHNASTITTTTTRPMDEDDHDDNDDDNDDMDPSLHLSFGIQHGCRTTVEAMLHHAVEIYVAATADQFATNVAIPVTDCINNNNNNHNHNKDATTTTTTPQDVLWKNILHFVISEVARRDDICWLSSSLSSHEQQQHRIHNNNNILNKSCFLRQSVPLSKAREEQMKMTTGTTTIGTTTTTTTTTTTLDDDDDDSKKKNNNENAILKTILLEGLQIVHFLVDIPLLYQFVQRLEARQGEHVRMYCHPYYYHTPPPPQQQQSTVGETIPPSLCPTAMAQIDVQHVRFLLLQLLHVYDESTGPQSHSEYLLSHVRRRMEYRYQQPPSSTN